MPRFNPFAKVSSRYGAPMGRPSERAYYVARRFVRRFGANAANERLLSRLRRKRVSDYL